MSNKQLVNNLRVLYVEDDTKVRELTESIFKNFFKEVVVAQDGVEGLEKFKSNAIDLVITDIYMPNMDGLTLIKEIKKFRPDIYSIVITANSDIDNFIETINIGVQGYIVKPLIISQFKDVLLKAIETVNAKYQIEILNQYKTIVDERSIVSKTDPSGIITFVNDKFCEISGYSKDELIGRNHNIIRSPDMQDEIFAEMWSVIKAKQVWHGQIKNRKKDGSSYYVDSTISPILDHNNQILEYIAIRNDISELINPKRQLMDALKETDMPFLVMLQIENFANLEYLYSENILESLEKEFEKKIVTYLPDGFVFDKIFNFENGEYVLLKDLENNTVNATNLQMQLDKFRQNIKKDILVVDQYEFDISIILSFATKKDDIFENVKDGLQNAIKTKTNIVFANDLNEHNRKIALKNTETIKMIQNAIKKNNIISYFQPIINNDTMEIEKYESLVRLIDDDGKVVSPFFFLDISKESGDYKKITQMVIKNSFAALEKTDKEISINLSALDIEDVYIRNELISLVTNNIHNAHRIVFELLEDEQVKDFAIVKDFISLVKAFGVKIAIDDFGAGVSNFERLLDYQPDILKIDACLIKNIDKDKYSRDVVETLQLFAWKQKIKTVAEFVETEAILQTVKDIGITHTQGYLLGKPQILE